MASDVPDEQLESVVRRAVRAELRLFAGRLFWTFVALLGIFGGFGLVMGGLNAAGWNAITAVFVVLGIALVGQGIRTLLLKWDLPPYHSADGRS